MALQKILEVQLNEEGLKQALTLVENQVKTGVTVLGYSESGIPANVTSGPMKFNLSKPIRVNTAGDGQFLNATVGLIHAPTGKAFSANLSAYIFGWMLRNITNLANVTVYGEIYNSEPREGLNGKIRSYRNIKVYADKNYTIPLTDEAIEERLRNASIDTMPQAMPQTQTTSTF